MGWASRPSHFQEWKLFNSHSLAVKSNRSGNHRSTLSWLYRAFKEDLSMALLRHNLYLLSIESILTIIVTAPTEAGLELKKASESSEGRTVARIEARTKAHRMLPSQVYERMRFNSLGNRKST
ncbi:hypothetical protein QUB28_00705 [Microcoleus sp. B4-C3]|uniref:hypothetical protein n=1 Tax=Microcoleus sp. B4-C2 TaxID=2818661 RepID=UPI002FD2FB66